MPQTVLVADHGPVRTLTLNRPHRRNALTPEMQQELIAALDDTAASSGVRALILTGAGEHFCAGLDISALKDLAEDVSRAGFEPAAFQLQDDANRISRVFRTLYELPIPTIAAVDGYALAGGTGLATLCDFTLATPAAQFGYTEARIGFIPALVSVYLTLQVGEKRARDLLLTARLFPASEAQTLGLVNEILPSESLLPRAEALAHSLLQNSPGSLRATKLLLARQNRPFLDAAIANALEANAAIRQTPEFREGITAFLEKRKPAWTS